MADEQFENWTTPDLIFELRLERTNKDPDRLRAVRYAIQRRESASQEALSREEQNRLYKISKFRSKSQLLGAALLIDEILVSFYLYYRVPGEVTIVDGVTTETLVGLAGFLVGQIMFLVISCLIYSLVHAIEYRRWDWFFALCFLWPLSVPYYLMRKS